MCSINLHVPYNAGKRMSIRELFNHFDGDGDGSLDKAEIGKLLSDLDVLEGLDAAAAAAQAGR